MVGSKPKTSVDVGKRNYERICLENKASIGRLFSGLVMGIVKLPVEAGEALWSMAVKYGRRPEKGNPWKGHLAVPGKGKDERIARMGLPEFFGIEIKETDAVLAEKEKERIGAQIQGMLRPIFAALFMSESEAKGHEGFLRLWDGKKELAVTAFEERAKTLGADGVVPAFAFLSKKVQTGERAGAEKILNGFKGFLVRVGRTADDTTAIKGALGSKYAAHVLAEDLDSLETEIRAARKRLAKVTRIQAPAKAPETETVVALAKATEEAEAEGTTETALVEANA